MAVHYVADPNLHAVVAKGLNSGVNFAGVNFAVVQLTQETLQVGHRISRSPGCSQMHFLQPASLVAATRRSEGLQGVNH